MAGAEVASVVRLAEGALVPSLVDVPASVTGLRRLRGWVRRLSVNGMRRVRAGSVAATTVPATAARMQSGTALYVAPSRSAASHLRGRVAESADVVRFAEGPAPGVERGGLQSCLIVPPLLGWRWVRLLVGAGHLYERTQRIEARRFIREDICKRRIQGLPLLGLGDS